MFSSILTVKVGSSPASLASADLDLLLVAGRARLQRGRHHRLGEGHPLQLQRLPLADGVAGGDLLEAGDEDDVARGRLLDGAPLVRVHAEEPGHPLVSLHARAHQAHPLAQRAGVDADEAVLPALAIGVGLEDQPEEAGRAGSGGRGTASPSAGRTATGAGTSSGAGR